MKPFSLVAAAIFLLIALAHLYRIAVGFPITVGAMDIAPALSWVGLVIASVMAVGLFREATMRANKPRHFKLIAEFDPSDPAHIVVGSKIALPRGDGPHKFIFTLHDKTGKNVRFARFRSADDCSTCPPDPGKLHTQIPTFQITNPHTAEFTNLNNNELPRQPQPMDVSYQWEFDCDSGFTVEPYDPIISNGGRV